MRSSNITLDQRWLFEIVDEVAGHSLGYVPHYPLGTKQDGFAKSHGLPFEATQGGKATMYPEYELKIKELLAKHRRRRLRRRADMRVSCSRRECVVADRRCWSVHAQQPVTTCR